jgi:hypothetical protein
MIELIAMSEYIRQDLGNFPAVLGHPNLFPKPIAGKVTKEITNRITSMLNEWLLDEKPEQPPQGGSSGKPTTISSVAPDDAPSPPSPQAQVDLSQLMAAKKKQVKADFEDLNSDADLGPPPKREPAKTLTISEVEKINKQEVETKKQDVSRLKPPREYELDPEHIDKLILQRSRREFGGQLVNIWNENMRVLYDKLQQDAVAPKRVRTMEDIQREDDKSNIVLSDVEEDNNGNRPQ